jgi:hypothetical protein
VERDGKLFGGLVMKLKDMRKDIGAIDSLEMKSSSFFWKKQKDVQSNT